VPLLADLQQAAPSLDGVLTRLGPFSSAARPALRGLGRAAVPATRALRDGRQEVDELRALSADAPATAKPLRQFLQTMDDRRRAIETDPRASVGGPPKGDPTHIEGKGGFTGLESLANYFFWQALSINAFDRLGHLLVVSAETTKCSLFQNDPRQKETLRDCNSWLGPRQPGINAPDPSCVSSPSAGPSAKRAERPARAPEPAAPAPAPTPSTTQPSDADALDYLLGP